MTLLRDFVAAGVIVRQNVSNDLFPLAHSLFVDQPARRLGSNPEPPRGATHCGALVARSGFFTSDEQRATSDSPGKAISLPHGR